MNDDASFFDNMKLPNSNPHEALETISRNYFRPLFCPARFEVRSEDYRDKGVDFQIEVIKQSQRQNVYTNFRFIVQLKATNTIQPNIDGSFSLQLETSNINYLLNHPMPAFYVLYDNSSGRFFYHELRQYTRNLFDKDPNWASQPSHTIRFSLNLDSAAVDLMYRMTMQKGIKQRRINEQLQQLSSSLHPSDKITLDINLEIVSDQEIRNLIEKTGFILIKQNRWSDILKLHKKASGTMETGALYNLVLGAASYFSGEMLHALTFLKAAKKKDALLQPELKDHVSYFEACAKYALGIFTERQYVDEIKLYSTSPSLGPYIVLENAKKKYFENCNEIDALKEYEEKLRSVILDPNCPASLSISATLEFLQIDSENLNMDYIRNISLINARGLDTREKIHSASNFLHWFHAAYQKWLRKIDELQNFSLELANKYLYHQASTIKTRMNYHLLVISREVFLINEHPALPILEFRDGDTPFRELLQVISETLEYFRSISHIENEAACLSLIHEIAHYINDFETSNTAFTKMEELVDNYELNIIGTAIRKLKIDGPYHKTFLKSFDFPGHAQQKKMNQQRRELKAMDRFEDTLKNKNIKGWYTITLHPIGRFSFPKEKKDVLYEIIHLTPQAISTYDHMYLMEEEPLANILNNPIENEGLISKEKQEITPESWQNLYIIRKKLFEEHFYRIKR